MSATVTSISLKCLVSKGRKSQWHWVDLGGGVPLVINRPDCMVISLSELPQTADQLRDWRLDGGGRQRICPPLMEEM